MEPISFTNEAVSIDSRLDFTSFIVSVVFNVAFQPRKFFCCLIMDPVSVTSSSPSTSLNNSVDLTSLSAQGKQSRVRFQARDDVLLLRELAAVEQPFIRGATCWETIASNLMEEFPDKFGKITSRFLRERATNLMEAFLKADTKQCKQSGTEEDFKEKEELLESLRDKFAKKDSQKQASLSAKHREKEDRERGEKI